MKGTIHVGKYYRHNLQPRSSHHEHKPKARVLDLVVHQSLHARHVALHDIRPRHCSAVGRLDLCVALGFEQAANLGQKLAQAFEYNGTRFLLRLFLWRLFSVEVVRHNQSVYNNTQHNAHAPLRAACCRCWS